MQTEPGLFAYIYFGESRIDTLKQATAHGTLITGAVTITMRVVNLIASIYILRLLDPQDFGRIALTMLILSTAYLLSDLGMASALIHTRHDRKKAAFQSHITVSLLSLAMFSIVYFNALPIAKLLGSSQLEPLLKWMSVLIVIDPASNIPTSLLRKDMQFKTIGISSLISELSFTAVQLTLAFLGFGVWSLVAGRLVYSSVNTILIWCLCPSWEWIKPKPWNHTIQKSLMSFGLQSTTSSIINFMHTNFDRFIIGRILGANPLGYYSKAYDLTAQTFNQLIRNVLRSVLFPSFSKINDDKSRLVRGFVKSLRFVLLLTMPMAFGIMALAPEMVNIVFGEKWLSMAPVLQISAFTIMIRSVSDSAGTLLQSLGKPAYNVRSGIVLLAIILPLSLYWLDFGIVGVAAAVAIGHVFGMAYNMYQINTLLPGIAKRALGVFVSMLAIGSMMACIVYAGKMMIIFPNLIPYFVFNFEIKPIPIDAPELLLTIALGALSYLGALLRWQKTYVMEIIHMMALILVPKKGLKPVIEKG